MEQVNSLQPLENERFHRWYRFVLAYPDKLVTDLMVRYGVGSNDLLLDPFCGTGTTLVAAKAAGIPCAGVDSNPAAVYASRIKTDWTVKPQDVERALARIRSRFAPFRHTFHPDDKPQKALLKSLRSYIEGSAVEERVRYFEQSGMLERRWMYELPMLQSFALMNIIETGKAPQPVTDLLRLLLVSAVQESIANIGFGPELYVKRDEKLRVAKDALALFAAKVDMTMADLRSAPEAATPVEVHTADSRMLEDVLEPATVSHVITSPPYPTEKDYTRNSRLELVFLGYVTDRQSLQTVKKEMIRSHSKGIYSTDDDGALVADVESVQAVAGELAEKAKSKTYGFAKLYPKILTEYFGGMRRHLRSLKPLLRDGGIAAYVVGEQTCYLQTFTPTATILADIAVLEGYDVKEILPFRVRSGTTGGGQLIKEEVLVLRSDN